MPTDTVPRHPRRGHGRATLADVAAAAGVTAITVSRYLREPHRVASETGTTIARALSETGYMPNKQAGALASAGGGGARMVAALIPSIANSIFAETVQGLADGLQGSGCELLLASTDYSVEREEEQLRALLGWFPSAIVVTGRRHTAAALELMHQARARCAPVIEIWDHHPEARGDGFTQIGFDHAQVGRAMAEHLIERGHRTLAYVDSGVAEDFRAHERGEGFIAAAKARRVRAEHVTAPRAEAIEAGRQALAALLDARGRPRVRAAAFANDHLACGALLEAQSRGLQMPRDLALLGFGDFALGRQLAPALSTVQVPRLEIGQATARALLAALASGQPAPDHALPWALLARAST
ncbi:MAG: substrate-binding domain-containing protein [Aquincola sp.]|nr:substrate-binding domain-containing protein [Aquincola sp.]MDH4290369.1 substrate-binding domain-containing protein [Aquincola sp.]MDH5331253.1 substrate-binding domain-containing protein [Aquincola sp.]